MEPQLIEISAKTITGSMPELWAIFFASALLAATAAPLLFEKIGNFIRPGWVERNRPKPVAVIGWTVLITLIGSGTFLLHGGIENWVSTYNDPVNLTSLKLAATAIGIYLGLVGVSLAQDLKTKTVPLITLAYFGVPTLLTLNWFGHGGPNTLFIAGCALLETLLLHLVIKGWEYYNLRSGKHTTTLDGTQEFSLRRKHGKWIASIGGEDEIPWTDLVPNQRSWGFQAITENGATITGWHNRLEQRSAEGSSSEWTLAERKDDFSYPVDTVTIPGQVMGRGDLIIIFLAGLALGPFGTSGAMLAGCIFTAVYSFLKGRKNEEEVAFVPGLTAGILLMLALNSQLENYREGLKALLNLA